MEQAERGCSGGTTSSSQGQSKPRAGGNSAFTALLLAVSWAAPAGYSHWPGSPTGIAKRDSANAWKEPGPRPCPCHHAVGRAGEAVGHRLGDIQLSGGCPRIRSCCGTLLRSSLVGDCLRDGVVPRKVVAGHKAIRAKCRQVNGRCIPAILWILCNADCYHNKLTESIATNLNLKSRSIVLHTENALRYKCMAVH